MSESTHKNNTDLTDQKYEQCERLALEHQADFKSLNAAMIFFIHAALKSKESTKDQPSFF